MRKGLLTVLASVAFALTAVAQSAGSYIYTDDARFKITTGENLISNGDFSKGTEGWTTDSGHELRVDTFTLEGTEGDYCLTVLQKDNGPGTGSTMYRKVEVDYDKTYIISYQVKAMEEVTTTITTDENGKNYQNIFFNADGSLEVSEAIATTQNYDFDWKTITYAFTPKTRGYIVFHFYGPYAGTSFDNFSIVEAQQVVDDRENNKLVAYLQSLIANTLLPNGNDMLEGIIDVLNAYTQADDLAGYNEILGYVEESVNDFLNQNSVDITANVPNGNLDDLTPTSANQTSAGAWIITDSLKITNPNGKSRWAVKSAADMSAPFTGNYLQNDVPYGASNVLRHAIVHQTLENMPAAQYMFTAKVRAYKLLNKAGKRDSMVRGMKIFINADSVECYPIDDENATTYHVFSKLDEVGSIKLGFMQPSGVANHVDLDFVSLRIIGWSQEQLDEYFAGKEFAEARQTLKEAIEAATEAYNNPDYLYDKPYLKDTIDASQLVYDSSKDIEEITAQTTVMNETVRTFKKHNNTLMLFREAIVSAEEMVANEKYTTGKEALQAAIATAKAYLATLTADNHETEGYTDTDIAAQTALLKAAINEMLFANIQGDEKYMFLKWAQQEEAYYVSSLDVTEENVITTSGNATVYLETSDFAGNSFCGRFAFSSNNVSLSLNTSHGLSVNPKGKNLTSMAILNLKEGDQVAVDWAMASASHSLMISSANAKYTKADGTEFTFTKTGKQTENAVEKGNTDGLSGSVHTVFTMTSDGTLDFYQGSSNSTLYIYNLSITYKDNVIIDGIEDVNSAVGESTTANGVYDLSGRKVSDTLTKGIYIKNGKKVIIK